MFTEINENKKIIKIMTAIFSEFYGTYRLVFWEVLIESHYFYTPPPPPRIYAEEYIVFGFSYVWM